MPTQNKTGYIRTNIFNNVKFIGHTSTSQFLSLFCSIIPQCLFLLQ